MKKEAEDAVKSRLADLNHLQRGEPMLVKGNEALAEAAVRAGCRFFFGYPITPQSELPHYMAARLPEVGGTYVQAESEVAAINMVLGASSVGARVLTSSSSPGMSLKQEGISYLSGMELPAVIINIVRTGPALGNLGPCQADYHQAVRGGGHGDYKNIVFGPGNLQEATDCMWLAFELADKYRNPVIVLGDGVMGQMMEPVQYIEQEPALPDKPWKLEGRVGMREPKVIECMDVGMEKMQRLITEHMQKWEAMQSEALWEFYGAGDAEVLFVSYGTAARVCRSAVDRARAEGLKVGLLRPITLWPFPNEAFEQALDAGVKHFITVELSAGQMHDDVRLAVNGRRPVDLHATVGGFAPSPRELVERVKGIMQGVQV